MKIKLLIGFTLIPLLALGITGCVPNASPTTTVSTGTDYGEQIETLTTQVALLNEDLADLKSQVNALDVSVPDYSSQISSLQNQINALESQLNAISGTVATLDSIAALEERLSALESANNDEEILALEAQIDELEASIGEIDTDSCYELIDELSLKVQALESAISSLEAKIAPRCAWVSAVGYDRIQITVSAGGNYPVIATFYGSSIESVSIGIPVGVTMYRISDRMEYGGYYLDESGLAQNATQAVVVVEPVNAVWAAGDVITLDIASAGNINYVTASAGMEH